MAFNHMPADAGSIPIAVDYTPGVDFAALEGSLIRTTDGNGNVSAPVTFHHSAAVVLNQASAAHSGAGTTTTGPYVVGPFAELAVDVNITAKSGTSPTIQFFIDRIGADGIAYNIWSSSSVSTSPTQVSTSIGSGFSTNQSFGSSIQLRYTIAGTTPSWTFSVSIIGK